MCPQDQCSNDLSSGRHVSLHHQAHVTPPALQSQHPAHGFLHPSPAHAVDGDSH